MKIACCEHGDDVQQHVWSAAAVGEVLSCKWESANGREIPCSTKCSWENISTNFTNWRPLVKIFSEYCRCGNRAFSNSRIFSLRNLTSRQFMEKFSHEFFLLYSTLRLSKRTRQFHLRSCRLFPRCSWEEVMPSQASRAGGLAIMQTHSYRCTRGDVADHNKYSLMAIGRCWTIFHVHVLTFLVQKV